MVTKSVLITGSSSGIGRALVKYFLDQSFKVYAGVRNAEDGAALQRDFSPTVCPLILDITNPGQIEQAIAKIGTSLDILVNNAGITYGGPVEFVDMDAVRHLFEVNVFGQIAVIQKALPLIRNTKGYIINVASIAGTVAQPYLAPYCASKHALEAFSIGLRSEVRPFGIKVAIIAPSGVDTVLWNKSRDVLQNIKSTLTSEQTDLYRKALDGFGVALEREHKRAVSVDEVVKAMNKIIHSKNPKIHYYVGPDARAGSIAKRLLPDELLYHMVEKRFAVD